MLRRQLGRTGLEVSALGFGASPLGNEFGEIDVADGVRAVQFALDNGINFFDTAVYYGRGLSESRLGHALEGRRHEAVICTKCARFDVATFDFSAQSAIRTIDESLSRLRTDYVDVLYVHDIEFGHERQIVEETLPALREIQRNGKARFIGITGLALRMLRRVAQQFPVDCVLSYCRYNLLNRDLHDELGPWAEVNGVGLVNGSPLHMGLLAETEIPSWHPAPEPVRAAGAQVRELCRQRGLSVSNLALQFALQSRHVSTTLVGMSTADQVMVNLRALQGSPDPELLAEVASITAPVRHLMWTTGHKENH